MKKFIKRAFPLIIIAIIILLSYASFYIKGGFIGDFGDPIGQTIPNKFLLIEYLKNGILPLWNNFSFLGFPFLADIQVGTFYIPDLIIFSILKPLYAHNASILLHLIFAGIGVYFFSKQITKLKIISIGISLLMVLTGSFLTKIVYLNFLETIVYIPWILFLLMRKKTSVSILAILFALMIFAGHIIAFFYSLIIIFIFFILNTPKKWKKLIIGFLIALFITAIQIIPFIELKNASVRDSLSYNEFIEGSLSIKHLLGFLTPFKDDISNPFDKYIHFGTFAFILLIISPFCLKKFNKKDKRLYVSGLVLCVLGIILSLGGNIPPLAKILYNIPIFNLIRVPARYMILFNFGAIFCLLIFLKTIIKTNKIMGIIAITLLIINSALIPSLFLDRHEIKEGIKEYNFEIKDLIENKENETFSLFSPPEYFLSSSFFLFPNRHILNYMPSAIGYNPMILKIYHDTFPISPVGAFKDPNYFINLYDKFEQTGLKYYIFPTEKFLKENNLSEKISVIDFLKNNGWEELNNNLSDQYDVWKNKKTSEFVYFLNNNNKIEKIDFKPGEINLEIQTFDSSDTLIVNQIFTNGWGAILDQNNNNFIKPNAYKGFLQSYSIPKDIKHITLLYKPKSVEYGLYLSLMGLALLISFSIYERKN